MGSSALDLKAADACRGSALGQVVPLHFIPVFWMRKLKLGDTLELGFKTCQGVVSPGCPRVSGRRQPASRAGKGWG